MSSTKSYSAMPATMSRRLDIGGENYLLPFLRESVEIMSSDPQKYGVCGYRISQLLPTQTVNSFDLSLLILDPVNPMPPSKPTMESVLLEAQGPLVSSSLAKEPAKEPTRETGKKSAKPEAADIEPPTSLSTAASEALLSKALEDYQHDYERWRITYRLYCNELEEVRKHDMAAMALLMHNLTPASRTRLTTSHLKDFSEAMSSKSGVALAKLLLVSHKPTDFELQESRLRLKRSFEGLKQGTTQMEMFIAKHMQVYKDLLDVNYTLDDLETRVNFRKALSTAFLEIFDAKTDHILPATLEECYEHATFAASVIRARRPALDRIPNHSAQIALSKPLNAKPSDRSTKPHGKKSTSSQPQGRKVVHSSRDNAAKPPSYGRKVSFSEPVQKPKWTDQSREAMFNPATHCQYCYDLLGRVFEHKTTECRRSKSAHSASFADHMSFMADHHAADSPPTEKSAAANVELPSTGETTSAANTMGTTVTTNADRPPSEASAASARGAELPVQPPQSEDHVILPIDVSPNKTAPTTIRDEDCVGRG